MAQAEHNSTIDPKEVAKFQALAASWWDPTGPFWPLHRLNALRIEYIKAKLCHHFHRDVTQPQALQGLRILDIGCGGGILSESVAALGAQVLGIDVVERNLQIATQHAKKQTIQPEYQCISAEELVQQKVQFDVVLNMEVVEHVLNLPIFMHSCNQLVKVGGVQFIATINRNALAWLVAIFGAEYILGWLPKGTHEYKKLVKPKQLRQFLAEGQFVIHDEVGVQVNPFSKQMSLVPFKGVNYMLYAAK